jgi:arabinogalactan endo-1,4-beta-galactosidase
VTAQKYAGGDISLLPSYEANGAKYYDATGNAISDVLSYFKDQGWNIMRVRLFVNPENASSDDKNTGVVQNLAYVRKLGKRIKDAGMKFMLDLHYSDSWADPAKQWTPQAWAQASDAILADSIYNYTTQVLSDLKKAGAEPDFIQTGNEISYGMDWGTSSSDAKYCYPSSATSNWTRFYSLLKKATSACRANCPNAQIILHVERVSSMASIQKDNTNFAALTGFFNKMGANGIDYDVVGLSYYPYYHGPMNELEGAIKALKNNSYTKSKHIMLVETGYPAQWAVGDTYDYTSTFPYTESGQKAYTDSLVRMLNKYDEVNGLLWWWPEANEYGLKWETSNVTKNWYNATLFNNKDGKAFSAILSLQDFTKHTAAINEIECDNKNSEKDKWYTINGIRLNEIPNSKGIYIKQGKKYIVK